MSKKPFDPKQYWRTRVGKNADLSVVGHRAFGAQYNRFIYQRRLEALDDLLQSCNLVPSRLAVLDIGCGSGFYTAFWKARGVRHYVGLDISAAGIGVLSALHNAYRFYCADISRPGTIPEEMGHFDLITVFDVLYHIVDDRDFAASLANISMALKADGHVLVFEHLVRKSCTLTDHVVFRGRGDYEDRLAEAGLRVVGVTRLFQLLVPPACGVRGVDLPIAALYKLLGLVMKRSPGFARWCGRSLTRVDHFLLRQGGILPNHELLLLEKVPAPAGTVQREP